MICWAEYSTLQTAGLRSCRFAAFGLVLFLSATPVDAYTQERINSTAGGFSALYWGTGSVIRYTFNQDFAPNNNKDLVRAAFRAAFKTWVAVMPQQGGKPVLTFEEAPSPTSVNRTQCDHINLITFTDTNPADAVAAGLTVRISRRF